ncbi:MAG: hypothetical protein ABR593_08395 [Candidatus Limnocylindria bacterium]
MRTNKPRNGVVITANARNISGASQMTPASPQRMLPPGWIDVSAGALV